MSAQPLATLSVVNSRTLQSTPPQWMVRLLDRRATWRVPLLLAAILLVPCIFLLTIVGGTAGAFDIFYIVPLLLVILVSTAWWPGYLLVVIVTTLAQFAYSSPSIAHFPQLVSTLTLGHVLSRALTFGIVVTFVRALLVIVISLQDYARSLDSERALAWTLATTDSLTSLANRRHFEQRLEAEHRRSARTGLPIAVLLLDVDHFKQVNDKWGHAAGDMTLQRVSAALCAGLRASDLAARLGGDEFAILLPETDERQALAVVRKIQDRLKVERARQRPGMPELPDVSIGLASATLPAGASAAEMSEAPSGAAMLARADQVLYAAKAGQRTGAAFKA